MPVPPRVFPGDEEWGKKHDDPRRKPVDNSVNCCSWLFSPGSFRIRRKRILPLILVLCLLYYIISHVFTNIAATLSSINYGPSDSPNRSGRSPPPLWVSPPNRRGNTKGSADTQKHDYNGPITFQKLASTLEATVSGGRFANRNVLYATASLKSAAILIPMACEMARWRRNSVHFVLTGRDDLPYSEILDVNDVPKGCDVSWHDARPDLSRFSSDARLIFSIQSAMEALHYALRPHAIIVDGSSQEEPLFLKTLGERRQALSVPIVEIPAGGVKKMEWVTRLDYGSLRAWDTATVDLLVHAPLDSSGSLVRLLKSLQGADYFSHAPPRLTIELPTRIDAHLRKFLEDFQWPPAQQGIHQRNSELVLRHHIPHKGIPAEELSTRFLESFYPKIPGSSHVLLLSPQAELSPVYFHYVKYTVLEYKHAAYAYGASDNMIGISLDLPTKVLNGTSPLNPPTTKPMPSSSISPAAHGELGTQFLWQAPSGKAALYFGEKWMELHDFLGNRFAAMHGHKSAKPKKIISREHPAWLEYLLEFMRIKGYWMLYPHFDKGAAIAKVHHELYQPPEEYFDDAEHDADHVSHDADGGNPSDYLAASSKPEVKLTSESVLTSILPFEGDLPEVVNMPKLSHEGELQPDPEVADEEQRNYWLKFRSEIGGCKGKGKGRDDNGLDLFCFGDG